MHKAITGVFFQDDNLVSHSGLITELSGITESLFSFLTDNDQQHSHEGQEGDVERAAERHAGDDEGHDEDEEADDHQSGDGFGPGCGRKQRRVHQRGNRTRPIGDHTHQHS